MEMLFLFIEYSMLPVFFWMGIYLFKKGTSEDDIEPFNSYGFELLILELSLHLSLSIRILSEHLKEKQLHTDLSSRGILIPNTHATNLVDLICGVIAVSFVLFIAIKFFIYGNKQKWKIRINNVSDFKNIILIIVVSWITRLLILILFSLKSINWEFVNSINKYYLIASVIIFTFSIFFGFFYLNRFISFRLVPATDRLTDISLKTKRGKYEISIEDSRKLINRYQKKNKIIYFEAYMHLTDAVLLSSIEHKKEERIAHLIYEYQNILAKRFNLGFLKSNQNLYFINLALLLIESEHTDERISLFFKNLSLSLEDEFINEIIEQARRIYKRRQNTIRE